LVHLVVVENPVIFGRAAIAVVETDEDLQAATRAVAKWTDKRLHPDEGLEPGWADTSVEAAGTLLALGAIIAVTDVARALDLIVVQLIISVDVDTVIDADT